MPMLLAGLMLAMIMAFLVFLGALSFLSRGATRGESETAKRLSEPSQPPLRRE